MKFDTEHAIKVIGKLFGPEVALYAARVWAECTRHRMF